MTRVSAVEAIPTDDDFRNLERTRLRALVARDFVLAGTLHSPEFHLVSPRGSTYSRESYFQAIETRKIVYLKWEAADIRVRTFGTVALLRYQADLEMPGDAGGDSAFSCWHTDSYELHDGVWQVVWSQATLIR